MPNGEGDYAEDYRYPFQFWKVIDQDPGGLNARKCSPGNGGDILSSPVIMTFRKGTELSHVETVLDSRGVPWFVVKQARGKDEQRFLVRANEAYIQPIRNRRPIPDKNGNYYDREQQFWRVKTGKGLNARMHPLAKTNITSADHSWPAGAVASWPVVRSFSQGTVLRAVTSHAGTIHLKEGKADAPVVWMLVTPDLKRSSGDEIFFIRAHRDLIEPVY
jgi:hypothetical protein